MTIRESPWLAFGAVLFACTGLVCYNAYKRDPEDTKWNDADIPPPQAAMVLQVPGQVSPTTAPMETSGPMRKRQYPASLISASASIIGTF